VFPLIERERVTLASAAVPLVTNWLNSTVPERCDLSSLRVMQNGGARLAPALRRQVEQRFGCIFQEDFGTAEGLLSIVRLDDDDEKRFNSSGCPISPGDEIRVVDDLGRDVLDDEPGELIVRGPYTIRGYYNAPEINEQAFTADGYYRMGDVVRRRDGYVYVEGRKKDLINRGGEKISCDEVEGYILAHPGVKGACLVAMPDPVYGEKACAFVIPKPGESISFAELVEFLLSQRIAKFKLPERLEIVDEFPISPAGKILRRRLREMIVERIGAEAGAAG
jgi:2,3-dihydroxybenzoate-AMP ligase